MPSKFVIFLKQYLYLSLNKSGFKSIFTYFVSVFALDFNYLILVSLYFALYYNGVKLVFVFKVSKVAKIRNRYNQVPHLTQDTNGKVTNSQKTPQTRAKRSALSQQVTTKHI